MTVAEEKIVAMIESIGDETIKDILLVCQKSKQYPRDCIVDGALVKLIQYIMDLERNARP